jgi:hypothetical protein
MEVYAYPIGNDRAGCPVELNGHVLSNFPTVLLIFVTAESLRRGKGSACVIVVGIMSTSYFCNASSYYMSVNVSVLYIIIEEHTFSVSFRDRLMALA